MVACAVDYFAINFEEVNLRIYQPKKVIFTEAEVRGEYDF